MEIAESDVTLKFTGLQDNVPSSRGSTPNPRIKRKSLLRASHTGLADYRSYWTAVCFETSRDVSISSADPRPIPAMKFHDIGEPQIHPRHSNRCDDSHSIDTSPSRYAGSSEHRKIPAYGEVYGVGDGHDCSLHPTRAVDCGVSVTTPKWETVPSSRSVPRQRRGTPTFDRAVRA